MAYTEQEIAKIIEQVIANISGETSSKGSGAPAGIPRTARVAMLTKADPKGGKMELFEYPIPPLGDDDILVKV